MYVLWSARLAGWFTAGATYTSDINQAKRYSRAEMIDQCKVYRGAQGSPFGMLPVLLSDLEEIARK